MTKEEFEREVRDYFRRYEQDLTLAEINIEWKRFQEGRSWFNEYLSVKEKKKNEMPSV